MRAIRALLVEDEPSDAFMFEHYLSLSSKPRFAVEHVETLDAAVASLKKKRPHVVVVDLNLPDSQGEATLAAIQKFSGVAAIVVLSGHGDEEMAALAVRAGAQNYLVKGDVKGQSFSRLLVYAVERQLTIQRLRQREAELAAAQLRLETLVANLPDGVVVAGEDEVFLVNPAARKLLGQDDEVILKRLAGIDAEHRFEVEQDEAILQIHARVGQAAWPKDPVRIVSLRVVGARRSGH